jgi:hypothetical protein
MVRIETRLCSFLNVSFPGQKKASPEILTLRAVLIILQIQWDCNG